LAGLGTGELGSHDVIDDWIKEKIPTVPNPENVGRYETMYRFYVESLKGMSTLYGRWG